MAEAYRGLTIRFNADAKSVLSTMRSMTKAAANVNSELKLVQRALRLDGGNSKAARREIQLLAEQAGLAQAKAQSMRAEYNRMANMKINGTPMRELSETTKNAASQASFARERYNALVEELAIVNKKMRELAKAEQTAENVAEIRRLEEEHKKLSTVLSEVEQKYLQLKNIEAFQSFGDKAMEEAAKAKAAIDQMVAASKAARPTGLEEGLKSARIQAQELANTGSRLKEAMHLDPSNIAAAQAHFKNLAEQEKQAYEQIRRLNDQARALGSSAEVRKMASDFDYLKERERVAEEGMRRYATELSEVQGKALSARNKILQLEEEMARLNAEGKSSEGVQNGIRKLTVEAEKAEAEVRQLQSKYQRFEAVAKDVSAANGLRAVNTEATEAKAKLASVETAMKTVRSTSTVTWSAVKSLGMTAFNTITPAAMMLGSYAIQSAKDVDGAYRNMRKTVDGTEEQFEHLKQAALEFGETHFTSADQILEIEALGGQLGIAATDLEEFSETISSIGIATDLDTETAALKLGQLSNILKLTKDDWEGFADALVRLGNNSPTLESSIMEVMSRISPMGAIVKMNADELLGWSTAIASTGQKSEAAGTAIARTMSQIEQAVALGSGSFDMFTEAAGMSFDAWQQLYQSGDAGAVDAIAKAVYNSSDALEFFAAACEMSSDEFQEAFDSDQEGMVAELANSLSEGTGKLEDFANVAGMTAAAFAELWESDPSEAMKAFIGGLKEIDESGGSVDATLADLKINAVRQKQALEGLVTTWDVLNDSLDMSHDAFNGVSDKWGETGDAAREAGRKAEGFSGLLQMIFNNGQELASMMGESLVPTMRDLLGFVQNLTEGFRGIDAGTQQALTITALGSALSGPLLTGVSSVATAFGDVKRSMGEFLSAESMVSRANKGGISLVNKLSARYVAAAGALQDYNTKKAQEKMTTAQANAAIGASHAKLQATTTGYKVATVAARAFSAVAGMAAIALAGMVIGKVVSYFQELHEHQEKVTDATRGLRDAMWSIKDVNPVKEGTKEALDGAADSMDKYKVSVEEAKEAVDNALESNANLAATMKDSFTGLASDEAAIQRLRDAMGALEKGTDMTEGELAELKIALADVNELTDQNLQLVAGDNGYEILTQDVIDARDAIGELQDKLGEDMGDEEIDSLRESVEQVNKQFGTAYTLAENAEGGYQIIEEGARDAKDAVYELLDALQMQTRLTVFSDLASEAQKNVITATSAYQEQQRLLSQQTEELRDRMLQSVNYTDEMKESIKGMDLDRLIELDPWNALQIGIYDTKGHIEEMASSLDVAKDSLEGVESAQKLLTAATDEGASAYTKAIASNEELVNQFVAAGANVWDFKERIEDAGVSIDQLAGLTDTQLASIATAFDGNLSSVSGLLQTFGVELSDEQAHVADVCGMMGLSLDQLNALGLDPKTLTIIDDHTVEDAFGNIWDLNKEKVNDFHYKVTDDDTIEVEGVKISQVTRKIDAVPKKATTAFGETGADHVKSQAGGIAAWVNSIDGMHATVTFRTVQITDKITNEITNKSGNAAGGVIPGHMAGGVLSGNIVSQPTLTNYGWVGEAGAEAIIPLTNRHYVRPFAQAVADEMGGGRTVNNYHYSINGITYEPDSRIAGLIGQVFDVAMQESRM